MANIDSGEGPIKRIPELDVNSANSAFSDKNPYPKKKDINGLS
jgi:hypothetical protein